MSISLSNWKMGIAFKHSASRHVSWKVPMIMCCNHHLNYRDDQGSVSRRLAIFKFDKYVPDSNSFLRSKIVKTELSKITVKCLLAYRRLREHVGSNSFWNACPDYFKDNVNDMNQCTDYIYMFLTLPPGDNVYADKDVYFNMQKGSSMLLQGFKRMFLNYMRFRHPKIKYK